MPQQNQKAAFCCFPLVALFVFRYFLVCVCTSRCGRLHGLQLPRGCESSSRKASGVQPASWDQDGSPLCKNCASHNMISGQFCSCASYSVFIVLHGTLTVNVRLTQLLRLYMIRFLACADEVCKKNMSADKQRLCHAGLTRSETHPHQDKEQTKYSQVHRRAT